MTDVWKGDVLLPDGLSIREVILESQNAASAPIIPASSLRFLSTVDTARIPLYLAAGPSLDVYTTEEATQTWFDSLLLSKASCATSLPDDEPHLSWWTFARAQSPIGILVQVDDHDTAPSKPHVTEILFYGTITAPPTTTLLTPPSSSPSLPTSHPPELRVHALPLSSDLLHDSTAFSPPTTSEPQFLHPHPTLSPALSPKRKRNIFDEAELARRKASRTASESLAAAAAASSSSKASELPRPLHHHRHTLSSDAKPTPLTDSRPPSAGILSRPASARLSRSPSISSEGRPLSRKGGLDGLARRSTLSQVATVRVRGEDQEQEQEQEQTVELRNKEALTRVVMAAMRMQGLQQRRRRKSALGGNGGDEAAAAAAEDAVKDEEFKLIYHQTYKGAVLAFRTHIAIKPLHSQPDRLRDVVEKLLAVFCTDPLSIPLPGDEPPGQLATPGSKKLGVPRSTHSQGSPFDLPSAARARMGAGTGAGAGRKVDKEQAFTGSPVARRGREGEDEGGMMGVH